MISSVFVSSGTYLACMTHALSAEREEVMGLLMGYFEEPICHIVSSTVLRRTDKRPDRVEICHEDLVSAIDVAETLSKAEGNGKTLAVVGWYHSHPHITPLPSAVDIRTQFQYQSMEARFMGLIFGVFDIDQGASKGKLSCLAFQSLNTDQNGHQLIPVHIVPALANQPAVMPSCIKAVCEIDRIVRREEDYAYKKASRSSLGFTQRMKNDAVRVQQMTRLLEKFSYPLYKTLDSYLHSCIGGAQ